MNYQARNVHEAVRPIKPFVPFVSFVVKDVYLHIDRVRRTTVTPRFADYAISPGAARLRHEEHEGHEEMEFDPISKKVIGSAIEVHRTLGPGLLENAYEQCLARELSINGINYRLQKALPVDYKGVYLDCSYRIDMLIEGRLIVELKSVDRLLPVHEAQILTYMRLADISVALLISFNVRILKEGIKRFVQ
jgi:GxxExxY protein